MESRQLFLSSNESRFGRITKLLFREKVLERFEAKPTFRKRSFRIKIKFVKKQNGNFFILKCARFLNAVKMLGKLSFVGNFEKSYRQVQTDCDDVIFVNERCWVRDPQARIRFH